MTEPNWVKKEVVLAAQNLFIAEHGGLEGLRDENLLESSLFAPQQLWHYSNPKPSIAELAARYIYSLSRNHPFQDGNKRTALLIGMIFLEENGCEVNFPETEAYLIMIELADKRIDEEDLIRWIIEKQNG